VLTLSHLPVKGESGRTSQARTEHKERVLKSKKQKARRRKKTFPHFYSNIENKPEQTAINLCSIIITIDSRQSLQCHEEWFINMNCYCLVNLMIYAG